MSDIFISYARSTEDQARQIAEALRALGYGVWRDDELPAHRAFSDVIEERLRAAKAVVVIWSADAVKSDWVRAEADAAREMGTLVQLRVDGAKPPMPFNRIQCADLRDWAGESETPGWRKVVASIADLAGRSGADASLVATSFAKSSEPLLAVLAFDNLSGDPEMAYFSDGVSEEILQTVARGALLKVIGRGSSFQFRGAGKAAAHVRAELKATHVLDGSVRRSGNHLRIAAHLIECTTETTLWSDRFEGDLTDIFAIQDQIATAVAAALKTTFAPPPPVGSIDPVAYDLFLRTRSSPSGGHVPLTEAIAMLEQAVILAPRLAAAWAELAHRRATLYRRISLDEMDKTVDRSEVSAAAEQALRLDPCSGLAYASLGLLLPWGDYLGREAAFEKALTAGPRDSRTVTEMGWFLVNVGRNEEALRYATQSLELDPLNQGAANVYAQTLAFAGRYDDSRRAYGDFRKRWPRTSVFTGAPLNIAPLNDDWPEFDRLSRMAADLGLSDRMIAQGRAAGEMLRDPTPQSRERILAVIGKQLLETGSVLIGPLVLAQKMGLADETFALIDRASFAHLFDEDGPAPAATYSPGMILSRTFNHTMMEDIRFVGFCAKLGLCDYWVEADRWPDCADQVPYDFRAEAKRLAGAHA